jgi:hypothetical protein
VGGGYRFSVIDIPADYDPRDNSQPNPELTPEQAQQLQQKMERSHHLDAGMHWTESIDYGSGVHVAQASRLTGAPP